jgi:tRNA (guanine37-N1)-methyltransferase
MLEITIFTIFPEVFPSVLGISLIQKAIVNKLVQINIINIRDYSHTKYKNVDDNPYGGGAGLIFRPDILGNAIDSKIKDDFNINIESKNDIKNIENKLKIIVTSAKGELFNNEVAINYAKNNIDIEDNNLYIICGRFEGIDQRFIDFYNAKELRIGDFVLFGGEVVAMAMCEAIIRFVPNVLGNNNTLNEESFCIKKNGKKMLEYPQYTKPQIWRKEKVPEVLTSGNHKLISKWKEDRLRDV